MVVKAEKCWWESEQSWVIVWDIVSEAGNSPAHNNMRGIGLKASTAWRAHCILWAGTAQILMTCCLEMGATGKSLCLLPRKMTFRLSI